MVAAMTAGMEKCYLDQWWDVILLFELGFWVQRIKKIA